MYGLAYVLVPSRFVSLQSELDQTLARFRRGGEDLFPRAKLTFDDATDSLRRLHRRKFQYNPDGSVRWLDSDAAASSFDLRLLKLSEHMAACRLSEFEGTFAELEPDFDAFVRRFTDFDHRDPDTSRYGRWLNPVGHWDWWELGGRFNGRLRATGDLREPSRSFPLAPTAGARSSEMLLLHSVAARLTRKRRSRPTWNSSQASSSRQTETTITHCRLPSFCRWVVAPTRIAGSIAWNGTRSGQERGHFLTCLPKPISRVWFGPLMTNFPSWRLPEWHIIFDHGLAPFPCCTQPFL